MHRCEGLLPDHQEDRQELNSSRALRIANDPPRARLDVFFKASCRYGDRKREEGGEWEYYGVRVNGRWHAKVEYPGEDQSGENQFLRVMVDKGTFPTSAPAADVTLYEAVDESDDSKEGEYGRSQRKYRQTYGEQLSNRYGGENVFVYVIVGATQQGE